MKNTSFKNSNIQKILITGSTGFFGRNLVEKLLKNHPSIKLTLLYHQSKKMYENQRNVNQVCCDIKIFEDVKKIFDTYDCVIHLAALNDNNCSIVNPLQTFNTNLLGTLNILECSRLFKIKKILLASSASVIQDNIKQEQLTESLKNNFSSITPYILTKKNVEAWGNCYAQFYDLPVAVMRIYNTYGPKQLSKALIPTLIFQALTQGHVRPKIGNIKKDFCYIKDMISAIEILMFSPWKLNFFCYDIGYGKSVSILNIIECLEKNFECQLLTDQQRVEYSNNIIELSKADISDICSNFNWKPKITPEVGINLSLNWYKENLSLLTTLFKKVE